MILEKGSFSIFPSNMCKGLPVYEQIVFIWICHHTNNEGACFPSLNTLASECGVSKDTITRSIKKLEDRGYITKIIRKNENGENLSNLYTVVISNANSGYLAADVDNPLDANSGYLAADVDTNYTNITKSNDLTTSLSYPPSSDEDNAETIFLNNQKLEEETPESTPKKETIPYVEIATLYNDYLGDVLPMLRNPKNLPATVKSHIKARFKNQLPTITHWDSFYIRICESDFLTGKIMDKEGKYPSFCDFYWIIKEMNCEKILSGKYDNKEQSNQPKRTKPWEIV